jgi:hypothetical protein
VSTHGPPFRLLVTRTWHDVHVIEQALAAILNGHPEGVLLVHGACPRGADAIAAAYAARTPGLPGRGAPRRLAPVRRAAGYRRNAEMIALGADGCAAFILGGSPGSTRTVRLATAAGIPVWLHSDQGQGAEPPAIIRDSGRRARCVPDRPVKAGYSRSLMDSPRLRLTCG